MSHDSWDDTLALVRRLLPAPGCTNRYRWIGAGAGLIVTAALVLVAIGPTPRFVSGAAPGDTSTVDGAGPAGPGIAATHYDPGATASSAGTPPSDSSGFSSSGSSGASSPGSGPSGSDPAAPLPPPAVVLEAEGAAAVRTGSAAVTADPTASGGAYVGGLGYWSDSTPAGSIVFNADLPSAGAWRLTIYFLDPGPKGPRHATVAVSGADPVDLLFAGPVTCCGTRTLDVNLSAAGPHTIAIGNPTDAGPSIDRITLTLLPLS